MIRAPNPRPQVVDTTPTPPEPVRIPSPDDPDLVASRRQKMQLEFKRRAGRASTALAGADGGGATQAYTRTTLG